MVGTTACHWLHRYRPYPQSVQKLPTSLPIGKAPSYRKLILIPPAPRRGCFPLVRRPHYHGYLITQRFTAIFVRHSGDGHVFSCHRICMQRSMIRRLDYAQLLCCPSIGQMAFSKLTVHQQCSSVDTPEHRHWF
jgi:hypothetical protein